MSFPPPLNVPHKMSDRQLLLVEILQHDCGNRERLYAPPKVNISCSSILQTLPEDYYMLSSILYYYTGGLLYVVFYTILQGAHSASNGWWWWWWRFPRLLGFLGECSTIHFPHALFLFKVEISLRTPIPLFRSGSVHSGSAS